LIARALHRSAVAAPPGKGRPRRTARHRLEEQLHLLSETSRALATAPADPDRLFREVSARFVADFCDICLLSVLSDDGTRLQSVAVEARSPELIELARPVFIDVPAELSSHPTAARVLATGEPFLAGPADLQRLAATMSPVYREYLERSNIGSFLMVPLRAEGRGVGLGVLLRSRERPALDAMDRAFVRVVADLAGVAIANARTLAAERQALAAEAEARRAFFDESPAPMWLALRDPPSFVAVNDAALALYGYTRQEFLALRPTDLLPPEALEAAQVRLSRFFDSKADLAGMTTQVRKDGTRFPVEYVSRPMTFAGKVAFVSVVRDVTDRMRQQEAQARLAAVVDASEDVMITGLPDGTVLSWNRGAERILGFTAAEMVGQSVRQLVPPDRLAELTDLRARLARDGAVAAFETERLHRDGHAVPMSVSIAASRDSDGNIKTLFTVARDISERKRLENQRRRLEETELEARNLQETNRLKSEFLSNMSHELRTPLNAVIGFATLLRAGKVGAVTDAQQDFLNDILSSSRQLLQIIDDVLEVVRIESGRMELQPRRVVVARLVHEVEEATRALAAPKGLRVSSSVEPALESIVTDARALKQILYNYTSNAVKFTPEGGSVSLRVAVVDDDFFRVDVEDTGIGVVDADVKRLFVDFQQLDAGTRKRYPGTGLGLALTKRIAEAMGGRVEVQSTPGIGSRFSAILPRYLAPSS
jgi:protein-histidine pros-kinase